MIEKIKKIGNILSNLLLGETKEIIIRTDETVKITRDDIVEIKSDCKKIWECVHDHDKDIGLLKRSSFFGNPGSPMIINKEGKELLIDCGFYRIYPELQEKIFKLMDTWKLRTLYDYETEAKTALKELENDPLIDPLKEYVVSHPMKITLEMIFTVASWIIRDDYDRYRKERL
ncbi:MAG: hypothetical protein KAQ87_01900 [Candidatus Pacebacteria bacterium]|nr:hypothetical protein [Candidatus Paceibacterota bacterium]